MISESLHAKRDRAFRDARELLIHSIGGGKYYLEDTSSAFDRMKATC
jgi:hypothetical protein